MSRRERPGAAARSRARTFDTGMSYSTRRYSRSSSLVILGLMKKTSTGRFSHAAVCRFGERMCRTIQLGNSGTIDAIGPRSQDYEVRRN